MANIDDEIPAGLTDKQVETLKQVSITEKHCQKVVEIMLFDFNMFLVPQYEVNTLQSVSMFLALANWHCQWPAITC